LVFAHKLDEGKKLIKVKRKYNTSNTPVISNEVRGEILFEQLVSPSCRIYFGMSHDRCKLLIGPLIRRGRASSFSLMKKKQKIKTEKSFSPQAFTFWPAFLSGHRSFITRPKILTSFNQGNHGSEPALGIEMDTSLAPNALCAYEWKARAVGNALVS
jgi:hypothetical protein